MADVIFFEKPGCAGNNRQKALLAEAGHTVHARDLLSEPWTADRLRPFFGDRPVAEWFNRAAPAVKSGEVDPDALDEAAALALMLKTPLLIRRPLMQVGDRCDCGFEAERVDAWIGLAAGAPEGKLEVRPRRDAALPTTRKGVTGQPGLS
uniref:Nitrogenase-associated protein n=2 Tax=Azospirillum brasilense TaxID=192 RepID=Q9JP46_AZOBR|nr:unknown [Azospirillum brasilense]